MTKPMNRKQCRKAYTTLENKRTAKNKKIAELQQESHLITKEMIRLNSLWIDNNWD